MMGICWSFVEAAILYGTITHFAARKVNNYKNPLIIFFMFAFAVNLNFCETLNIMQEEANSALRKAKTHLIFLRDSVTR
jgi:hypothetical protein